MTAQFLQNNFYSLGGRHLNRIFLSYWSTSCVLFWKSIQQEIFGVRWPLTGHTMTWQTCCKVKGAKPPLTLTSMVRSVSFLTHFLRQKFFNFFHNFPNFLHIYLKFLFHWPIFFSHFYSNWSLIFFKFLPIFFQISLNFRSISTAPQSAVRASKWPNNLCLRIPEFVPLPIPRDKLISFLGGREAGEMFAHPPKSSWDLKIRYIIYAICASRSQNLCSYPSWYS